MDDEVQVDDRGGGRRKEGMALSLWGPDLSVSLMQSEGPLCEEGEAGGKATLHFIHSYEVR